MAERERWRITLTELCYVARCSIADVERWAKAGYLGKRVAEPRDQGFGRHITRDVAQRAVLMARCVDAGLTEKAAGALVVDHRVGDTDKIDVALTPYVVVSVSRKGLP